MKYHPTLPTFGAPVPGAGGVLGAIMRGELVDGQREPDYALILPTAKPALLPAMAWGTADVPGATSLTDGRRNTAAMHQAQCPPATAVRALQIDGHTDFYIPSRAEMWALRANVPEMFTKETCWTSTQAGRYTAIAQDFANSLSDWSRKGNSFLVRPVRQIPLQHFTT